MSAQKDQNNTPAYAAQEVKRVLLNELEEQKNPVEQLSENELEGVTGGLSLSMLVRRSRPAITAAATDVKAAEQKKGSVWGPLSSLAMIGASLLPSSPSTPTSTPPPDPAPNK